MNTIDVTNHETNRNGWKRIAPCLENDHRYFCTFFSKKYANFSMSLYENLEFGFARFHHDLHPVKQFIAAVGKLAHENCDDVFIQKMARTKQIDKNTTVVETKLMRFELENVAHILDIKMVRSEASEISFHLKKYDEWNRVLLRYQNWDKRVAGSSVGVSKHLIDRFLQPHWDTTAETPVAEDYLKIRKTTLNSHEFNMLATNSRFTPNSQNHLVDSADAAAAKGSHGTPHHHHRSVSVVHELQDQIVSLNAEMKRKQSDWFHQLVTQENENTLAQQKLLSNLERLQKTVDTLETRQLISQSGGNFNTAAADGEKTGEFIEQTVLENSDAVYIMEDGSAAKHTRTCADVIRKLPLMSQIILVALCLCGLRNNQKGMRDAARIQVVEWSSLQTCTRTITQDYFKVNMVTSQQIKSSISELADYGFVDSRHHDFKEFHIKPHLNWLVSLLRDTLNQLFPGSLLDALNPVGVVKTELEHVPPLPTGCVSAPARKTQTTPRKKQSKGKQNHQYCEDTTTGDDGIFYKKFCFKLLTRRYSGLCVNIFPMDFSRGFDVHRALAAVFAALTSSISKYLEPLYKWLCDNAQVILESQGKNCGYWADILLLLTAGNNKGINKIYQSFWEKMGQRDKIVPSEILAEFFLSAAAIPHRSQLDGTFPFHSSDHKKYGGIFSRESIIRKLKLKPELTDIYRSYRVDQFVVDDHNFCGYGPDSLPPKVIVATFSGNETMIKSRPDYVPMIEFTGMLPSFTVSGEYWDYVPRYEKGGMTWKRSLVCRKYGYSLFGLILKVSIAANKGLMNKIPQAKLNSKSEFVYVSVMRVDEARWTVCDSHAGKVYEIRDLNELFLPTTVKCSWLGKPSQDERNPGFGIWGRVQVECGFFMQVI